MTAYFEVCNLDGGKPIYGKMEFFAPTNRANLIKTFLYAHQIDRGVYSVLVEVRNEENKPVGAACSVVNFPVTLQQNQKSN